MRPASWLENSNASGATDRPAFGADSPTIYLGVAAAFLVAVSLRFFHLDSQSLWVDEIFTWYNAAIGGSITLEDIFQNDHGPLLQIILHQVGNTLGDSEGFLRLPSALATVAMVPVLAALAGNLLGRAAIVPAAWLAALSPYLIWYGQEARNYAFAMLFATLAAWAVVRLRESGGAGLAVLFVLSAWFGLLSNLNVSFVLPVLFLYLLLPHSGTRGRPLIAIGALLGLVVLELPWILEYVDRLAWERLLPLRGALPDETPLRGVTTFSIGGYPFTFSTFSVGYTLGPSMRELHTASPWRVALQYWPILAPAVGVFGFLTIRGVLALRSTPGRMLFVIGLILIPLLAVTYVAIQNFKVFNPRYVSAGVAGYYLLLIAGWISLRVRWRVLTATVVLILWGLSLNNHYFDPAHTKDDFRGATEWLASRANPGDQLIVAANYGPMIYYWRNHLPEYEFYWLGYASSRETMEIKFEEMERRETTTWVIVSRPYDQDPKGLFENYLQRQRDAELESFPGVRVYRLDSQGEASAP